MTSAPRIVKRRGAQIRFYNPRGMRYNKKIGKERSPMSMTLETIRAAHARIAPYIVPTLLLRLPALDDALGCEVYVKAECMQRTGAFKLRGAMNKILALTDAERARGFVAASSGNHGRAVAYAAQRFGTYACIVMPETAPAVKQAAIRALGAELVLCVASERFAVAARLCAERDATMVPPFNDELVMAGQGTVGLEIMAQCPEIDAVVVPVSGGGLIGGVSTAVKALAPRVRVFGAEPAALPRYTESLRAGHPVQVEQKRTVADALVAQIPGDVCFPYVAANTDGFADVADDDILRGMKLLLLEGKLLCEPSSAIGIGAALAGQLPVRKGDKVCFVVSGGSVALEQLHQLEDISL